MFDQCGHVKVSAHLVSSYRGFPLAFHKLLPNGYRDGILLFPLRKRVNGVTVQYIIIIVIIVSNDLQVLSWMTCFIQNFILHYSF